MYTRYISNKIYQWFIFDDDGDGEFALTLFFPMFLFDPRKSERKPLAFSCFQGDQKGTQGRKVKRQISSWDH